VSDAVRVVESEVRELIRRSGLDPARHPVEVGRLVQDVISDYDERSLHGGMPAILDRQEAAKQVMDVVAGFGPLQRYFDDPTVEEIWINEPSKVFVARRGIAELTTTILTPDEVRDLVERMLRTSGRRVDLSSPFVDATLPDGSRLHVVIPDITRDHWHVNIRKFVVRADHLDDLVRLGTLTGQAARFLEAAVVAGLNILVAGGTQAGKTTLLNCLAASIPPRERIVTCEEVFELKIPLRDVASMQCRQPSLEGTGEVPLRRLVKEALRMRPSRIIVGEVRQAESLDLLIALNSGVPNNAVTHFIRAGPSCPHLHEDESRPERDRLRCPASTAGLHRPSRPLGLAHRGPSSRQRCQCILGQGPSRVSGSSRGPGGSGRQRSRGLAHGQAPSIAD